MSATAGLPLPSYTSPLHSVSSRTPSYSVEPGVYEQRLALNHRRVSAPTGAFIKSSKSGDARLRLTAQKDGAELPVYGNGGNVEGTVELSKTEHISTVEVRVEGRLSLREMGEGGRADTTICLDTTLLWIRDERNPTCPSSLQFSLKLPATFGLSGQTFPLPPSHSIKLKGLPGFYADIEYSVSAVINKPRALPNIVPLVKSKKLGINIGNTTVSTPFIYYPRTRPGVALPSPMQHVATGFIEAPGWKVYNYMVKANNRTGAQNINVKLYLPASRIFCSTQTIPFYATFEAGNAFSLATFLPYAPVAGRTGATTRLQMMRQSTVDVRATNTGRSMTEIWRVDQIGEGVFEHISDGPTWMSFSGTLELDPVKVTGFNIGRLSVVDCLLFTVTPPDVTKAAFVGIRHMIPVRLTTDPWSEDGRGMAARDNFSVPSSPDDDSKSFHAL